MKAVQYHRNSLHITLRQQIGMRLFIGTLQWAGIVFLGSGCATVMSPPYYTIPVTSEPSGATVKVFDEFDGSVVATTITPGEVSLRPQAGPLKAARYEFQFEKEGYRQENIGFYSGLNPWFMLDIPCGLFYFTPLLMFIDAAHGSMYELRGTASATLHPVPPTVNSPGMREAPMNEMPRIPAAEMERKVTAASVVVKPKPVFDISAHVEDDPSQGDSILGNGDGLIQKGEAFDLVVVVTNASTSTAISVTCAVILPADNSLKAFSELNKTVTELAPAAALTNRVNLAMPLNAIATAPTCIIEVRKSEADMADQMAYVVPMALP